MLSDQEIFDAVQPHLPRKGHAYIWATDPEYAKAFGIEVGTRWIVLEMRPENTLAASRAIESAATAPLLAEIERLTRELEEAPSRTLLDAATKEIDNLTRELEEARKDAGRLDWLDNNVFAKDPDEWDQKYGRCRDGKTQMWAIFAPKCVQGSARRIIDAAIKEKTK